MGATLVLWEGRAVFVYIKTIYINYINKTPCVAPSPSSLLLFLSLSSLQPIRLMRNNLEI
jgi:hypothetical protein